MTKPVLFNTEMVRAILDGRKTVTRRALKGDAREYIEIDVDNSVIGVYDMFEGTVRPVLDYAPYRPGDILYVRETFCTYCADHVIDGVRYAYKADATPESERIRKEYCYKYRPSIHMPKEAARVFLRVTDVRVEKLQDISVDGVEQEGVPLTFPITKMIDSEHLKKFITVWNSTIKKSDIDLYSWQANPWVWVIEFERISKEDALNA